MGDVKTTFVFNLTAEQQMLFRGLISAGNYRHRKVPYTILSIEGNGFNCSLYEKERKGLRKLSIQGGKSADFVEFVLQPNGVVPVTMGGDGVVADAEPSETAPLPHVGSDESGKGDYFGPLVIAACYVDEELAEKFRNLKVEWFDVNNTKHVDKDGVRDCKLITNNVVLMRMGQMIREMLGPDRFSIVKIGPAAYNRLYAKIKNVNRVLAWAHSTCIEEVLQKQPDCKLAVVDQFAQTESVVKGAMKELGKKVTLEQRHKAESYAMGVAAASVIAREAFLRAMCDIAEDVKPGCGHRLGVVPLGASDQKVRIVGEEMVKKHGSIWLMNHCKTHFQTTDNILLTCKRSRKELPPEGQITSTVKSGEYRHV